MHRWRTFTASLAVAVLLGAGWLAFASRPLAQSETTVLGDLISRALSTPTTRVSIGAVDGALSSDATIRNIVISDRDGVWLKLDRARLVWRRAALLSRRLEIDRLEVGRLEVLRRPAPAEDAAPSSGEPLLPELPVKVEVKAFSLADLTLSEPVVGTPARLSARGATKLGPPSEGLDLTLEARRLDAQGGFTARLGFVPTSERLELKFAYDEPAGGLVAHLAKLPGLPPVKLDLDGRGPLNDWAASLTFQAGADIGAQGQARLVRTGAGRRLTLDLASQVEGLLPAPVAPVFAGTTRLQGATSLGDNGAIAIDRLELTSRTASLTVAGSVSGEQVVDLTATARALPTEAGLTRAADAQLDSLVFDGSVKGPLTRPRVAGRLRASGLRVPQGQLGQLAADITADPIAADPGTAARFAVRADVTAGGVALTDTRLAQAVGDRLALTLQGIWGADAVGDIENLQLTVPALDVSYKGRLGPTVAAGTLDARLKNLAAFSDLAGRRLAGTGTLSVALDGNPRDHAVRAAVDLNGQNVGLDMPIADRLLGARLSLKGRVEIFRDGIAFESLHAGGAHLTADLTGRASQQQADITARMGVLDLAKADQALNGRADITARLTGSLASPDVAATVTTTDAQALGRPLRDVRLEATLKDLMGDRLDGAVRVSGSIGGKPLKGHAHLLRSPDQGWFLDQLDLGVGSAAISGRVALDAAKLADGVLRVAAENLDDLSPLVLTPLGGALNATITLSRDAGRQGAEVTAQGRQLRAAGVTLGIFDARLSGTDLFGRPVLNGRVSADRLVAAGETVETLRLDAAGTPAASDLALTGTARGFALSARARLVNAADRSRLEIGSLSAERQGQRLGLAQPATVTLDDGAAVISGLVIAANRGRISVDGRAGRDLDLKLAVRALPLSVMDVVRPGLGLAGTLDGEAELRGSAARPEGRYRVSLARFAAPQTRDAGLPPIDATASGGLSGGRASVDVVLSAGGVARLQVSGTAPLDVGGALDLRARGQIDAALANAGLSASGGQKVTGRVALDATVGGTYARPQVGGSATLSGGSFTDPLQGVRLTGIEGRLTGRGDAITVERLTAATRNGGALNVTGRVAVEPEAGFPGSLRITGSRAELVSNELATAVASLDLMLAGPLTRAPKVSGRVDLVSLEINVPDRLPATVRPIPGTRHIAAPPQTRARLAANRPAKPTRGKVSAPFNAALDLTLAAPNRIFVRGRGIDAELGGDLKLTGTSREPVAVGAFELRRGRLSLAGQRLEFSRGRLAFAGDLTPDLDFVAETKAGDVTARVAVSGSASQPAFDLTSEPALPRDEVLARLLFAKASGSLSAFQALQLAQAVAQLSGTAGGPDVFDQARRSLGLDSLDITTGTKGGPAVGASRYIGDRVSVGVRAGARPEDAAATVNVDVTRRLKVQGEVGADGRTSVGVGAEWEY